METILESYYIRLIYNLFRPTKNLSATVASVNNNALIASAKENDTFNSIYQLFTCSYFLHGYKS